MRDIDEISGDVVDVALGIHRELGPGLFESVYEAVLAGRLEKMGHLVERQVPVAIVERLTAGHAKQVLTYLRLSKQPVGLLINFSGETLKEGLRRIVNSHHSSSPSSPRLRVNQSNGS